MILTLGGAFYIYLTSTGVQQSIVFDILLHTTTLFLLLATLNALSEYLNLDTYYRRGAGLLLIFAWIFFNIELLIDVLIVNTSLKNGVLFLSTALFLAIYENWLYSLTKILKNYPSWKATLIFFQLILAISILATSSLGYYQIGVYLMGAVFKSTICLCLFFLLWQITKTVYNQFNDDNLETGKKVRQLLSVEDDKVLIEFLMLKIIIQLFLVGFTAVALISVWVVSINFYELLEDVLFYNIKLGNLSFSLLRVIIGLSIFSSILLLGRVIASVAVDKKKYRKSDDTQVVLSSVIVYISFSAATIIGLVVMGVDFTGLAIIAGALSVGVGLGLQNIVNNFVSGLILLIEQPVKPGDRVVIGNTEGIVKKIRIRSTQIKTMAKEDVIVPNADLIANQVTNYMYKDRNFRIVCQVGVAYGSDTELVCKLLNDVAIAHPDVLNNTINFPKVLFRQFGDSSLIFELWSTIKDVNNKYVVHSDLNLAIDKAFRENNVVVSFPQMDVHVKEEPSTSKDKI